MYDLLRAKRQHESMTQRGAVVKRLRTGKEVRIVRLPRLRASCGEEGADGVGVGLHDYCSMFSCEDRGIQPMNAPTGGNATPVPYRKASAP